MSLRINLNSAALSAHRYLGANDNMVSQSIERLSSGYRINRASDDPAGLSISEALRAQIGGLKQAISNTQDAVNMVKTAEGALTEVHSLLRSMRDLSIHAQNTGAIDANQLAADQAQITSAIDALNRISTNTAFGGKKLLDGSAGVAGSVTSGTGATFVNGTATTKAGTYTVTVNNVATQHTYVGDSAGAAAAVVTGTGDVSGGMAGVAGDLVFNDANGNVLATVTLAGTETQAQVRDAINTALTGVTAPNSFVASNSGNFIRLTQSTAGAEPGITISASSDAAVLTKLGFTAGTTNGSGNFTAQGTAGTLTINGVNISILANDTTTALVNRINTLSGSTGVSASANAAGRLSLTTTGYGSSAALTVAVSGGYTAAQVFGATPTDTAGTDLNLTVQKSGGTATTAAGSGQIWTGVANTDSEGMQLKVTATGSKTIVVTNGSLAFQVGSEVGQTATIALNGTAASKLGTSATGLETSATSLADINVNSAAGARDATRLIDAAIAQVSSMRSGLGAAQKNVFESAISSLQVASENIAASESSIRDTDMAAEMSQFSKSQILEQSTVAMLGQANAVPRDLLQLLRG